MFCVRFIFKTIGNYASPRGQKQGQHVRMLNAIRAVGGRGGHVAAC